MFTVPNFCKNTHNVFLFRHTSLNVWTPPSWTRVAGVLLLMSISPENLLERHTNNINFLILLKYYWFQQKNQSLSRYEIEKIYLRKKFFFKTIYSKITNIQVSSWRMTLGRLLIQWWKTKRFLRRQHMKERHGWHRANIKSPFSLWDNIAERLFLWVVAGQPDVHGEVVVLVPVHVLGTRNKTFIQSRNKLQ